MQSTTIYSNEQKTHKYTILDNVNLSINVLDNPFSLNLDNLFEMGARVNPKRSFLFISRLLGKHLDVHPDIPKVAGHLLANLLTERYEGKYFSDTVELATAVEKGVLDKRKRHHIDEKHTLNAKTLFIGFAETATGLGHAVFSAFDNAYYVHTTREIASVPSVFDFQEEHSHATEHLCYLLDTKQLETAERIVLVDDEITTGNTCLNLIRSLNELYPNKEYAVVSLLDWRTPEHVEKYEQFQKELGIKVDVLTLLRGELTIENDHTFNEADCINPEPFKEPSEPFRSFTMPFSFKSLSGRFGIHSKSTELIEDLASQEGEVLASIRKGKKTLCVGNGEFIYLPSRIASYMGNDVHFKTSTRSPIVPSPQANYPIHDRITYSLNNGVTNYLYNIHASDFDEVLFFTEEALPQDTMQQIHSALQQCGVRHITFIH